MDLGPRRREGLAVDLVVVNATTPGLGACCLGSESAGLGFQCLCLMVEGWGFTRVASTMAVPLHQGSASGRPAHVHLEIRSGRAPHLKTTNKSRSLSTQLINRRLTTRDSCNISNKPSNHLPTSASSSSSSSSSSYSLVMSATSAPTMKAH